MNNSKLLLCMVTLLQFSVAWAGDSLMMTQPYRMIGEGKCVYGVKLTLQGKSVDLKIPSMKAEHFNALNQLDSDLGKKIGEVLKLKPSGDTDAKLIAFAEAYGKAVSSYISEKKEEEKSKK